MSVKVAIRVRPFNSREQFLGCIACVQMKQKTTVVYQNRGKQKKPHYFTFDYSFWSHDGFQQKEDGLLVPVNDKYVDQLQVYQLLGEQVLQNAWVGFNCCLFAYGQTGAGKSYSMIGYGPNKGIIPMVCQQLFTRMKRFQKKGQRQYQVAISMLEIYNQKVQDLLVNTNKRPPNGLKIRQNKALGVYVQGLKKFPVTSYLQIQKKMEQGSKNRSLASTLMNEYSSRAHTIVMIQFIQKQFITATKMNKKSSIINLVDLAGSQRVSKTGVGDNKDRLKEASLINKSLHTLGRVIEALAEQSLGKLKNIAVPYRQSALTRILQNALGGNSKTTMICAISPANDNCEETISTLRYADKTKKIKNKPVVNESQIDKLIRQLRQENQRLKKMLNASQQPISPQKMSTQAQIQRREMKSNVRASMRQIQKQLKKNLQSFAINTQMIEQEQMDQQSIMMTEFIDLQDPSFSQSQSSFTTNSKTQVYITNLNQDQFLNFKVKYSCEKINLLITNKSKKKEQQEENILQKEQFKKIVLCGLGIQENHAKIFREVGKYFIQAFTQTSSEYTLLNGKPVYNKQQLYHNDRIILGINSVFLFKNFLNTKERPNKKYTSQKGIGYEFAINQRQNQMQDQNLLSGFGFGKSSKSKKESSQIGVGDQQMREKLQQIQKQFNKMIEENQKKTKQKEQFYKDQMQKLQKQKQQKQKQKQTLKSQLKQKTQETVKLRGKELQIQKLHKKLAKYQEEKQKRNKIRESMLLEGLDEDQGFNNQKHYGQMGVGQDGNQYGTNVDFQNSSSKKKKGAKKEQKPKIKKSSQADLYDDLLIEQYDDSKHNITGTTLATMNQNSTMQQQQSYFTNIGIQQNQNVNQSSSSKNKNMKKNTNNNKIIPEFNQQQELQRYHKMVEKYLLQIREKMHLFTKLYDITIYSEKKKSFRQQKLEKEKSEEICKNCNKKINNCNGQKSQHSGEELLLQQENSKIFIKDNKNSLKKQSKKQLKIELNKEDISIMLNYDPMRKQSQGQKSKGKSSNGYVQDESLLLNETNIQGEEEYIQNRKRVDSEHFKKNLKQIPQQNQDDSKNYRKSHSGAIYSDHSDQNTPTNNKKSSIKKQKNVTILKQGDTYITNNYINYEKESQRNRSESKQQIKQKSNSNDQSMFQMYLPRIDVQVNESDQESNKKNNKNKNNFSEDDVFTKSNVKKSLFDDTLLLDQMDKYDQNQDDIQEYLHRKQQALSSSSTKLKAKKEEKQKVKEQEVKTKIIEKIVEKIQYVEVPSAKKQTSQIQIQTEKFEQQKMKSNAQQQFQKQRQKQILPKSSYITVDFDLSVSDIQDDGDHDFSGQQSLNFSALNNFKQMELNNQIQMLQEKIKLLQKENNQQKQKNKEIITQKSPQSKKKRKTFAESSQEQQDESQESLKSPVNNKKKSQNSYNLSPSRLNFLKRKTTNLDEDLENQLHHNLIQCNNQNIINERNLQIRKRKRQAEQLKKLLFKKQKIELQKQLLVLIPMLERFNLIAKEMKRLIQGKIEIEYRNFSHYEIIEALKNYTKSKWSRQRDINFCNVNVKIVVANLEDARIYKWPIQVFKNRYQIAEQIFQKYLQNHQENIGYNKSQIDKNKDPFWDPLQFIPSGFGYLSLESLLYDIGYQGFISFVNNGKIIGKAYVILSPVKVAKRVKEAQANEQAQKTLLQTHDTSLQIFNPRNCLENTLYFNLCVQSIILNSPQKNSPSPPIRLTVSYDLLEDDYKSQIYTTPQIGFTHYNEEIQIGYQRRHCFKQVSQSTLAYISDCPIKITVNFMKDYNQQCLNSSFNEDSQSNSSFDESSLDLSQVNITSDLQTSLITPQKSNSALNSQKKDSKIRSNQKPDFSKKQKTAIFYENVQIINKIEQECKVQEQKRRRQKKKRLDQKSEQLKKKKQQLNNGSKDKKQKQCIIY